MIVANVWDLGRAGRRLATLTTNNVHVVTSVHTRDGDERLRRHIHCHSRALDAWSACPCVALRRQPQKTEAGGGMSPQVGLTLLTMMCTSSSYRARLVRLNSRLFGLGFDSHGRRLL